MAGLVTPQGEVQHEMNVMPLIDVLLVLVIILFLLQRILTWIPAQVPPPAATAPTYAGVPLVPELRGDGGLVLNGQPVPDSALERQLRAALEGRPRKLLFLKVDDTRRYDDAVHAMDRAREAGVEIIAWVPRARE